MHKKILLAISLLVATSATQAAISANWNFNDTNDSISLTTGTLTGGATISGGALNLTGTGGFDSNTDGGLGGTGSFTVVSDFNTTAASDQTIFSYSPSNGSDGGGDLRLFVQANGNLRIEMSFGAGFEADLGTLNLNDGATHRVAAVFDSSAGDSFQDVDLYVDGTFYNVTGGTDHAIDLGATVTVADEFSVGYQLHVPTNRTFSGTFEFTQIYDTALSGAELAAIPEPAAYAVFFGLTGLALTIRRRK
jgi:hypothetical protein